MNSSVEFLISQQSEEELLMLLREGDRNAFAKMQYDWDLWALPHQKAPSGEWLYWLLCAGRAAGKTRAGSEWIRVKKNTCGRIALVAETAADARDVIVEGDSGILRTSPPWDRPKYEPSKRRLTWDNGAMAILYAAESYDQLRGPNNAAAWVDEIAKFQYAVEAWDQLQFTMRARPSDGSNPQTLITTTPRAIPIIKKIISDPLTRTVVASTYANQDNLAPSYLEMLRNTYEGTTLGQQEIHAAILDENKGALWRLATLEATRVMRDFDPSFWRRTAIGVDPATVLKRNQTGIVGVSKGGDGHGYVRADASGAYSPYDWATRVVQMFIDLDADEVVAEGNQGGEMVRHTIHSVNKNIPVKIVHARHSKQARAEPVAMLYEQQRFHHLGVFRELETQMVTWEPESGDESPDRIDALVWAARHLFVSGPKTQAIAAPYTLPVG